MRAQSPEPGRGRLRSRVTYAAGLAALVVLLAVLEQASFRGTGAPVRTQWDTTTYLRVAGYALTDARFYTQRPFAVPLLFKLCGSDGACIVAAQSALSIAGWVALGAAAAHGIERTAGRLAVVALFGAFSLAIPVNQWDHVLLSESASFSLVALLLALLLALVHRARAGRSVPPPLLLLWGAACLLLTGTRDSTVYLLAVTGAGLAALALAALRGGRRRTALDLSVAVVLLGLAAASGVWTNRAGQRWKTPFLNVLLQRVLPDPELHREWRERHGLPTSPPFAQLAGLWSWSRSPQGLPVRKLLREDRRLTPVDRWIDAHGISAYQRHLLLDRPGDSLRAVWEAFPLGVNPSGAVDWYEGEVGYAKGAGVTPWTSALTRVVYPDLPAPGAASLFLLAVGLMLVVVSPASRTLGAMTCAMVLLTWSQAFVAYHGDAADVRRHMFGCGILLRVGLLFAVVGAARALAARLAGRLPAAAAVAGLVAVSCGSPRPQPTVEDVVLVVVDTLRADHLGTYGYERPTSERLDRRAEEGVVFERAFATSPWTLPTFGTLLTGLAPRGHRAGELLPGRQREGRFARRAALSEDVPTLAELLRDAGWRTAAFVANPFLGEQFGLARGFEHYDLRQSRANRVVDRTLEWLDGGGAGPGDGDGDGDGSRFVLVHFIDPHVPYTPPPASRGRFAEGARGTHRAEIQEMRTRAAAVGPKRRAELTGLYDEEVAFVDRELGRLFDGLRERGVWDDALVLLTADHGEELFDHDGFEHGHTVYQELLHVPLVVWGPGIAAGREAAPISSLDVAPTVLEAAGLPRVASWPGVSLLPRLRRGESIAPRRLAAEGLLYQPERRALIEWPLKLVEVPTTGERELYDLAADPGERRDLAAERPEEVERLAAELERTLRAGAAGGARAAREARVDDATLDELEALGYTD